MKKIKVHNVQFIFVIGLGYWKDVYIKDKCNHSGVVHNVILPFIRIGWGYLHEPTITFISKN